ncbi:hypothetical protein N5D52_27970 [Pseudomonas sp. GD03860]|uniref:hypothetical protein n=1 Tax=Pseudomonas TaxID=286 RepID=UPI002364371F|nr:MULTISPECIES: hypothetical protein [Pseudomonas]MDD2059089.1 hypothetical protein [Pseudomonas putida]MDH0640769.1 hypothetical protein [Pseudomonas sp. GD03860]
MNKFKPQISLAKLAKAVADYDGRILDPRSESGRVGLLEIAADLLENPMENAELLDLLSRPDAPSQSLAWSRPGEMMYLETVDITPELEIFLDDLDHLRTKDLLDRELESQRDSVADVILTPNIRIMASPNWLGFDDEMSTRTFNHQAFYTALSRVHRDLKRVWKVRAAKPSFTITSSELAASPDRDTWTISKTIRAENFHEVTVRYEKKAVHMAYIGSGNDLFLKVTINNHEVARAKESLTDSKHFVTVVVDSFAAEPEAGLMIVDSILEEIQHAKASQQAHDLEP